MSDVTTTTVPTQDQTLDVTLDVTPESIPASEPAAEAVGHAAVNKALAAFSKACKLQAELNYDLADTAYAYLAAFLGTAPGVAKRSAGVGQLASESFRWSDDVFTMTDAEGGRKHQKRVNALLNGNAVCRLIGDGRGMDKGDGKGRKGKGTAARVPWGKLREFNPLVTREESDFTEMWHRHPAAEKRADGTDPAVGLLQLVCDQPALTATEIRAAVRKLRADHALAVGDMEEAKRWGYTPPAPPAAEKAPEKAAETSETPAAAPADDGKTLTVEPAEESDKPAESPAPAAAPATETNPASDATTGPAIATRVQFGDAMCNAATWFATSTASDKDRLYAAYGSDDHGLPVAEWCEGSNDFDGAADMLRTCYAAYHDDDDAETYPAWLARLDTWLSGHGLPQGLQGESMEVTADDVSPAAEMAAEDAAEASGDEDTVLEDAKPAAAPSGTGPKSDCYQGESLLAQLARTATAAGEKDYADLLCVALVQHKRPFAVLGHMLDMLADEEVGTDDEKAWLAAVRDAYHGELSK